MNKLNVKHIMAMDLPFVEPRNERRGGWSGVSTFELAGQLYYIKRQKNHTFRDWRAGFSRVPTLRREVRNMLRLQRLGIKSPEIIAYGEEDGDSILVTLALSAYVDLDAWLAGQPDQASRQRVFKNLGATIVSIHQHKYHHGCFYGRHVMVNPDNLDDLALLDLEKLRLEPRTQLAIEKDLSQLIRRTPDISNDDIEQLYACYQPTYGDIRAGVEKRVKEKR